MDRLQYGGEDPLRVEEGLDLTDIPEDLTLGEIYRSQLRLEWRVGKTEEKVDRLEQANLTGRMASIEASRQWIMRIVVGGVITTVVGALVSGSLGNLGGG